MTGASVAIGGNAKVGPATAGTLLPKAGTTSNLIAAAIRELQPRKSWAYLAEMFGMSERCARNRLSESREFTVDELAALIRSEDGLEVLRAIVGDAKPKWWRLVSAFMDVAEAQRLQATAQKRITRAVRGAIEANDELEQTIARGTLALSFHDQEFHSAHAAAEREFYRGRAPVHGIPDRALAPAKVKGGPR